MLRVEMAQCKELDLVRVQEPALVRVFSRLFAENKNVVSWKIYLIYHVLVKNHIQIILLYTDNKLFGDLGLHGLIARNRVVMVIETE